jgi:hypothetical protein
VAATVWVWDYRNGCGWGGDSGDEIGEAIQLVDWTGKAKELQSEQIQT